MPEYIYIENFAESIREKIMLKAEAKPSTESLIDALYIVSQAKADSIRSILQQLGFFRWRQNGKSEDWKKIEMLEISQQQIDRLHIIALQIAEQMRGQAEIQPVNIVLAKLNVEFGELAAEIDQDATLEKKRAECADLEYYLFQLLHWLIIARKQAQIEHIPLGELAAAKYQQRITNNQAGVQDKHFGVDEAIRRVVEKYTR